MHSSTTTWPRSLGLFITGACLVGVLSAPAVLAQTSTVSIPLQLNYKLLQYLLEKQLFKSGDKRREILDDATGCNRIFLSEPVLSARESDLEIIANVDAKIGIAALGKCRELLKWQGQFGFLGTPAIQSGATSIKLTPVDTWLVDKKGTKVAATPLLESTNASLRDFLGSFVLDLEPHLDTLSGLLPEVLPQYSLEQLQAAVNTLKVADLRVSPATLDVSINFELEALPPVTEPQAKLTPDELKLLETRWKMMDALLVSAVKQYASETHLQALRDTLFDVLIESRFRLLDALSEPGGQPDEAVRHWFIESWQTLAPVVESIALEQEGEEHLLWFNVLTAADALHALDALGPSVGLDISANGLRQLARMINEVDSEELLRYSEDVDPELQELLKQQLEADEAALEQLEEAEPVPPDETTTTTEEPSAMRLEFSIFPRAHAQADEDRLSQWVPERGKISNYLPLVSGLLDSTVRNILAKQPLERSYRGIYEKLVLATAWQESCWRQFVLEDNRIQPLISSSGDIGMMQINERVWRGFYDMQKLRWDINYNSQAGSEILLKYLVRYALKKQEQERPGGLPNLARASYSAYNGGPSQVSRYRSSNVAPAHKTIDEQFWDKYRQVNAGKKLNVAKCLTGNPAHVPNH